MPGKSKASEKPSRRSDVIEATIRVVGRKGLGGASVRAIAHELGQTIGVVTHHFRDKSELLCAALESCFLPWHSLVEASRSIEDPMERLRWIMMETLTEDDHPAAKRQLWLGMLSQIDQDPEVAEAYRAQYAQTRHDMIAILADCQRAGYIEPGRDLEDEAVQLQSLADGLLVSNAGDFRYFDEIRIKRIMARHLEALANPELG